MNLTNEEGAMSGMDFVIIANAWEAGIANPTSKHRIALDLARRGHRVLWLEGAGMRQPSIGSGSDRSRILKKLRLACRGARRVEGSEERESEVRSQNSEAPNSELQVSGFRSQPPSASGLKPSAFNLQPSVSGGIWVLSPLLIPLPSRTWVRRFNGWLCARLARFWTKRLGFHDPVLINYVPVLAEAMRAWKSRGELKATRTPNAERRTTNICVYHCVDRWDAFKMYDTR